MEAIKNILTARNIPIFILMTSAMALLIALGAEYIFGMAPCILCLYERIPYVIAILFISLALTIQKSKRIMLALCIITFIGSVALSFYHVGVEYGLFKGTSSCNSSTNSEILSIEELKQQIKNTSLPSCSTPAFKFVGVSMTGWNFILSLILLYFSYKSFKDS